MFYKEKSDPELSNELFKNPGAPYRWYGPNLWRTEGNKWSYEYQLDEMGVLTSPVYWLE